MMSWVSLFSKFTSEAIVLEGLVFLFLLASYMAFWVLRKRRYGSIHDTIPSGPVKTYLNELIHQAEQIRFQLFGVVSSSQVSGLISGDQGGGSGDSADVELAQKLIQLEAKVVEQTTSLQKMTEDKSRLEKALEEARSAPPAAAEGAAAPVDNKALEGLQTQVKELEAKLAEYSVIEDDLANLKRLQQENTYLKNQLAKQGGAAPAAAVPASSSSPDPATPAQANPSAESAPEAPAAPAGSAPDGTADPNLPEEFEKMLQK